jgi:hypothetical protein
LSYLSRRSGLVCDVAAGEGAVRLVRVDHAPGPSPNVSGLGP